MGGRKRTARRGESLDSPYAPIEAFGVEAFGPAAQESPLKRANRLIEKLRIMDPLSAQSIGQRISGTKTLAILAREVYFPDAIAEVQRQLGGAPWPPRLAFQRFQTLMALGWAQALQGDWFSAFLHFKEASASASIVAQKALVAAETSMLAKVLGERRWSRVELADAEADANQADWAAVSPEERLTLLTLAQLFSPLDLTKTAAYLTRYSEVGVQPLQEPADAGVTAAAAYTIGVVEIALHHTRRGLGELRRARRIFERLGYDFRVALCAIAEYRVTSKADLLSLATEQLRNYGSSWLAAELRGLGEQPGHAPLTRMQQRVFEEMCLGKTTAEIAETLGRSHFTINNHIKEIFKVFNVSNRASLLAEAGRRGFLKSP